MSKTKRNLIIIGSIVGVLLLLTIIFGTLFSVRTITVDYLTTTFRVEEYSKTDIKKAAKISKGKNIVFLEFDKNEKALEKEFPYAKFNIVRVFPSTVIIYVHERKPIFRILKSGFWFIFDEDLKCLEVVAGANINLNNNENIPVLHLENYDFDVEAGEFLVDNTLKQSIKNIVDGVYGFEETPVSILSDITLLTSDILGTQVISLKIKETGATLVVQGTNLVKEKIAYATYVYISDVSQNERYMNNLSNVTITVYQDFTMENKKVIVSDK